MEQEKLFKVSLILMIKVSNMIEKRLLSWAAAGLLIFVSSFFWAPSRDGIQIIFLLGLLIPIIALFLLGNLKSYEYFNIANIFALIYAGYSLISVAWGDAKSAVFFLLQWIVLATWLIGSSVILSRIRFDIDKCIFWFLIIGSISIIISIGYFYYFVFGVDTYQIRLLGWNVFRNANEIGAMCGVVATVSIVSAFQSDSIKRAYVFYLLSIISIAGLILSFSRGAILGFFIVALLSLIIVRPPVKIWVSPVLILFFVVLAFVFLSKNPIHYFEGRGSGWDRFIIWQYVFAESKGNVFFGIGMSKNTMVSIPGLGNVHHAHNAWIDTYYRTGIIGLLLIILHLIFTTRIGLEDKKILPLLLWLCFGCICSLFDGRVFFWEIGAKWFLYWLPAGLIVANAKLSVTPKNSPTN